MAGSLVTLLIARFGLDVSLPACRCVFQPFWCTRSVLPSASSGFPSYCCRCMRAQCACRLPVLCRVCRYRYSMHTANGSCLYFVIIEEPWTLQMVCVWAALHTCTLGHTLLCAVCVWGFGWVEFLIASLCLILLCQTRIGFSLGCVCCANCFHMERFLLLLLAMAANSPSYSGE